VNDATELERLRRALRSLEDGARTGPDCPDPARLWDAAALRLTPEERRAVVDHSVGCSVCAEALRLAGEIRAELPVEDVPGGAARVGAWRALPALALAASVVLAAALGIWTLRRADPASQAPEFRDARTTAVRSLVDPDAPLPRESFTLRWSDAAPGSRYAVRVSTEALDELDTASELAEASYQVPEAALRGVRSGARVLWQVHVTLPDGRRFESETFLATVR
jgi:hypothetical protein